MSRPLLDIHILQKHTRTHTHTYSEKSKYTHSQTYINLLVRQGGRLPSTAKNLVGGRKEAGGMEK